VSVEITCTVFVRSSAGSSRKVAVGNNLNVVSPFV
jgi:hypothetical protein